MARPSSDEYTFTSGFVVNKDCVYVLTDTAEEAGDDTPSGLIQMFDGGEWVDVSTPFVGLVGIDVVNAPNSNRPADLTLVSVEGDFLLTGSSRKRQVGKLDAGANGPSGRGWIRGVRRIGKQVYAVGMSRQAYVSGMEGQWKRIDADILGKLGETLGLNDVDGFSEKEVYAAGLGGEIWRYDGKRWTAVRSPTNVQINAVRRCGDHIYMVGGAGVVLRGRHEHFEIVDTETNRTNLYAVEMLADTLYVASLRTIYRLRGDALQEVKTGLRGSFTTGSLHSADGVLWSVGAKHLVTTKDGVTWKQMFI
jgi:hypothetical protein